MNVEAFLVDLFDKYGGQKYADEDVTQTQHAVQCALLARSSSYASDVVITAALLHDVGHLLAQTDWPADLSQNLDDQHEELGYRYLVKHFGPEVAEPVQLHVASKRYLCTAEPEYQATLSPTSLKSFHDQGGLMSTEELESFREHPRFELAVQLRRWDDQAKDTQAPDLTIADFLDEIRGAYQKWNTAKAANH